MNPNMHIIRKYVMQDWPGFPPTLIRTLLHLLHTCAVILIEKRRPKFAINDRLISLLDCWSKCNDFPFMCMGYTWWLRYGLKHEEKEWLRLE